MLRGWAQLPLSCTRQGRSPQPLPGRAVQEEMGISGSHQLSTFTVLSSSITPGSSHACSHTRATGQTHNTAQKRAKRRGKKALKESSERMTLFPASPQNIPDIWVVLARAHTGPWDTHGACWQ